MSDKRLSQRALRELGIAEDQIAADNKAAVTLAALLHQPCEERWTDKRGDTHIQVTMHGPDAHMQEAARLIAAGVTLAAAYAPLDVAAPLDEFGNPAYADDATNWAYEAGRRTGRAEPRAEGLRATALGSGYAWFDEKTDRYVIAVDDLRAALEEPTP